jgi:trigger factor
MAFRLQRIEEQLQQAGLGLDAYMQQENMSEEQLEADLRAQGERNVRAQLLLEAIAQKENFTASDEEVGEEVKYLAEASRTDVETLTKELKQRDRLGVLAGDIIRRKALNYLVDRATITDEEPEEASS